MFKKNAESEKKAKPALRAPRSVSTPKIPQLPPPPPEHHGRQPFPHELKRVAELHLASVSVQSDYTGIM